MIEKSSFIIFILFLIDCSLFIIFILVLIWPQNPVFSSILHRFLDIPQTTVYQSSTKRSEGDYIIREACSNSTRRNIDDSREFWKQIDRIVEAHPKAKKSGGIFLYPRQASILLALLQYQVKLHSPGKKFIVT